MDAAGNEVWELLMLPSISCRIWIGIAGTYLQGENISSRSNFSRKYGIVT